MARITHYNTMSAAIEAVGLGDIETIPDGILHRFSVPDDKPGQESGWYVDYSTGGVFGNWKSGEKHKFYNSNLTMSERKSLKIKINADKKERLKAQHQKHDIAAGNALTMWNNSEIATTINWVPDNYIKNDNGSRTFHLYPLDKEIKPYGARIRDELLLIPVYLVNRIVSLQLIDMDGNKRFYTGGRVKGCFCPIGKLTTRLYICEGYATGCSIHEFTGQAVAVAFNAGNLLDVAQYMSSKYPEATIIIVADNDAETERKTGTNPGLEMAKLAARSIGAKYIYPEFSPGIQGTDLNDFLTQGGESWVA